MSLGFYRVIKGNMIVRQRQSPDGDSMRFVPDDWTLFEDFPRYSPPAETASQEPSYQLRFQAIDTPELHYGGAEQPHGLESRNGLLQWLDKNINLDDWDWKVAPSGFEYNKPGAILCNEFEGHGRPIAFVFKELDADDGSELQLNDELLRESYNYYASETGLAYLGLYAAGLSLPIRTALIAAYKAAKQNKLGIWKIDKTKRFTVNTLDDLGPEQGSLVYPKIFRRCVDALRWAGGEFEPGTDVDDFLVDKPGENDKFKVMAGENGQVTSRLTDVIEQINNQIRIQVDLNTVQFVSK